MPENIFKNFGARQNQFRSGCRPLFRQTAVPRPRRFISQPAFAPSRERREIERSAVSAESEEVENDEFFREKSFFPVSVS